MPKHPLSIPLLTLLLAVACSEAKSKPRDERVPVSVAAAQRKTVPIEITAIGHVEPLTSVAVRSQVSGQLQRVWFREGDDVRRGALLFTIDARPYQAALAEAEADLARDVAQAKTAEAEAARSAALASQGLVTQQENERRSAAAQSARATVAASRAAVAAARLQLSYCQIRSPIDGRTGRLMVHPGNLVRANDTTPLVTINQLTPIVVAFSVPQNELAALRARSGIRVTATPPNGQTDTGVLSFIDNRVDPGTGTIAMKARFQNSDRSLWPGQFVKVAVNVANAENVVVVPARAVQTGQKGQFVWVVGSDGSVSIREVAVSGSSGGESIIAGGVAAGELVVTEGQLRLTPKSKVEIRERAS